MTVKLARFFSTNNNSNNNNNNNNSSNANNNGNNGNGNIINSISQHSANATATSPSSMPPPLQPRTYYPYQKQQKQQQQYSPYIHHGDHDDDDDDDDNMSLYSTTASNIMTTRDHPYNNSQRPLLAERKPQLLLLNKKKFNNNNNNAVTGQQKQPQKPYISPYVQQQKRDSAKGLHGFNDFNILSQQYTKHLQSPHIGYPYGSPPSPTANSYDFVFDTPSQVAAKVAAPSSQPSRYANINGISNCGLYATVAATPVLSRQPSHHNSTDYYANYLGSNNKAASCNRHKPSQFEDDFCSRQVSSSQYTSPSASPPALPSPPPPPILPRKNGPFIFGVPPEQQADYTSNTSNSVQRRVFSDSTDTVITLATTATSNTDDELRQQDQHHPTADDKYSTSMRSGQTTMQSTSDTSTSSCDINSNKKGKKAKKFSFLKRKGAKAETSNKNTREGADVATDVKAHKTPTIKCVVVGDAAVGKTNLIASYLENRFNAEHVPTASDIYNANVMVNDSPVHLTLCDTAGQDTLDPLRELCYPDSDVFLLCFSVTKPETFHAIKTKWAPKFCKTKAALILVGTQSDLRANANVLHKLQTKGEKPISYADAWDLAQSIGAKYVETSSKTKDKVKEVFDTAIWEGLVPNALPPTPTPPLWKRIFCLV